MTARLVHPFVRGARGLIAISAQRIARRQVGRAIVPSATAQLPATLPRTPALQVVVEVAVEVVGGRACHIQRLIVVHCFGQHNVRTECNDAQLIAVVEHVLDVGSARHVPCMNVKSHQACTTAEHIAEILHLTHVPSGQVHGGKARDVLEHA